MQVLKQMYVTLWYLHEKKLVLESFESSVRGKNKKNGMNFWFGFRSQNFIMFEFETLPHVSSSHSISFFSNSWPLWIGQL